MRGGLDTSEARDGADIKTAKRLIAAVSQGGAEILGPQGITHHCSQERYNDAAHAALVQAGSRLSFEQRSLITSFVYSDQEAHHHARYTMLHARVTPREYVELKDAATRSDCTLSEWVRTILLTYAKKTRDAA
jgi:hypothetical protein